MPEPHSQADEAARYVLGQLTPKARHEFEVQLTQSAELRALVQELEEGIEATARAVPQRPPPSQLLTAIDQAITREVERKVVTPAWSNWWRNGWAAAAACLLAFVSYAWWSQRQDPSPVAIPVAPLEMAVTSPPVESSAILPGPVRPETRKPTNVTGTAFTKPAPETVSPELASLRWQITALQSQLQQLSEVVSQQKAILTEPGRFKFFPLTSATTAPDEPATQTLSPGLQRAISYAMARDLGWLPRTTPSAVPNNNNSPAAVVTTVSGIDFVEFNKSQNPALTAAGGTPPPTEAAGDRAKAATISVRSSGTIPGYLRNDSGNELVFAVDATIVSSGSVVEFWGVTSGGGQRLIGSALTSDNPLVVTVPTEGISGDLTITTTQTSGTSLPLGQFHIVRYPPLETGPNQSP